MKFVVVCRVFFFFQAEDGIRDTSVTGVQTCALPILRGFYQASPSPRYLFGDGSGSWPAFHEPRRPQACKRGLGATGAGGDRPWSLPQARSEERRVGEDLRSHKMRQW